MLYGDTITFDGNFGTKYGFNKHRINVNPSCQNSIQLASQLAMCLQSSPEPVHIYVIRPQKKKYVRQIQLIAKWKKDKQLCVPISISFLSNSWNITVATRSDLFLHCIRGFS